MRLLIIIIQLLLLPLLFMVRTGEVRLSKWFPLRSIDFYAEVVAGFAIFLVVLQVLSQIAKYIYRKRHRIQHDDNFGVGIDHIYSILVAIGAFIAFLSMFKVEVKEVFTSISIVFAGIAIITKDYIGNMISGMIITFSGHLSIHDHIKIGEHKGKIIDITLQNIHLLNEDDDYIYIPNNLVFATQVINYTKRLIKKTSIEFEVDLRHLETVEELESAIIEAIQPFHELIKPESYYLRVAEIHKDFVLLKFQYVLKEPNREMERSIRRTAVRKVIQIINDFEKRVPEKPIE